MHLHPPHFRCLCGSCLETVARESRAPHQSTRFVPPSSQPGGSFPVEGPPRSGGKVLADGAARDRRRVGTLDVLGDTPSGILEGGDVESCGVDGDEAFTNSVPFADTLEVATADAIDNKAATRQRGGCVESGDGMLLLVLEE